MRIARAVYSGCLAIGDTLAGWGVSPNALTILSVSLAALGGVAAAGSAFGWAAVLLVVSGVLDMLDGIVARSSGRQTRFGALLDSAADRVADAAPLIGLAYAWSAFPRVALLPVFALLAAFVVSYVRARSEALGARLPGLWMRRAERLVWLIGTLLLAKWSFTQPAHLAPALSVGLFALVSLLSAGAALAAARRAFKQVGDHLP